MVIVDRFRGRREMRVGESADRDSDYIRLALRKPEDRAAAARAEVMNDWIAAIGWPLEDRRSALKPYAVALEECSDAESTSGPPLAFKAMAQGN